MTDVMGCASSTETKHVIYVKPRAVNGTNSVNELKQINLNYSQSEQRSDKTPNNNNANVNDNMLSSRDKDKDKASKPRETSLLNNEAERKAENKDSESLIKPGDEDDIKDEARRPSHQDEVTENVKRSTVHIERRMSKESDKNINRKFSDARTNASSITEWETDSELAVDKDIEEVDATTNKDYTVTGRTEAEFSKTKVSEKQEQNGGIDDIQHDTEQNGKNAIESANKESKHVIASYIGSDENEKIDEINGNSSVKAYANYVGSGNDEKQNVENRENRKSQQHPKTAQNLKDSESEKDGKTKQTEKHQRQQENKDNTELLVAKRDDSMEEAGQNISDTEDTGPAPTLVKAKDIMPSADTLKVLADQVKQVCLSVAST